MQLRANSGRNQRALNIKPICRKNETTSSITHCSKNSVLLVFSTCFLILLCMISECSYDALWSQLKPHMAKITLSLSMHDLCWCFQKVCSRKQTAADLFSSRSPNTKDDPKPGTPPGSTICTWRTWVITHQLITVIPSSKRQHGKVVQPLHQFCPRLPKCSPSICEEAALLSHCYWFSCLTLRCLPTYSGDG